MKKPKPNVHFTIRQARELSRLLGAYQTVLGSEIESLHTQNPMERPVIAALRKLWREAENFQMLLTEKK